MDKCRMDTSIFSITYFDDNVILMMENENARNTERTEEKIKSCYFFKKMRYL